MPRIGFQYFAWQIESLSLFESLPSQTGIGFWLFSAVLNWVSVDYQKKNWVFVSFYKSLREREREMNNMVALKKLWMKKTIVGLVLGQLLSLLITSTGFSSSELARKGPSLFLHLFITKDLIWRLQLTYKSVCIRFCFCSPTRLLILCPLSRL